MGIYKIFNPDSKVDFTDQQIVDTFDDINAIVKKEKLKFSIEDVIKYLEGDKPTICLFNAAKEVHEGEQLIASHQQDIIDRENEKLDY
jgi:hypothetical protein